MMNTLIAEQNPWWKNAKEIEEDPKVSEALSKQHKLTYSFNSEENRLIFGPRQIGKTTYLKLLIHDLIINKGIPPKQCFYFTCDILRNSKELLNLIRTADKLFSPKYFFLDEISFVEGWERAVKYLMDSAKYANKVFYLTGSSSVALKRESFPGRNIRAQEFLPLSFRRFIKLFGSRELKKLLESTNVRKLPDIKEQIKSLLPFFDEVDSLFYKYLQCGGFPRAFYELMENGEIRDETFDIYWQWVIGDVVKLKRSQKIATGVFRGILKNYTSKFSLSSISREMEIGSHVTVREYLELLEDLFVIRNFYTFDLNRKTVIYRKMRKVYFIDPFLYNVFEKKLVGKTQRLDRLVEGVVAEHVIRFVKDPLKVGFYHGRKEIDIVVPDTGIEVKWQKNVNHRDFPKVDVKNKIILSQDKVDLSGDVLIVPASLFLCVLRIQGA